MVEEVPSVGGLGGGVGLKVARLESQTPRWGEPLGTSPETGMASVVDIDQVMCLKPRLARSHVHPFMLPLFLFSCSATRVDFGSGIVASRVCSSPFCRLSFAIISVRAMVGAEYESHGIGVDR